MNNGISQESSTKLINLFKKTNNLTEVKLYGSRALGTYKEWSDIDISIMDNEFSADDLLQLSNNIDDLLIPYKVDISIFKKLDNVDLIKHINNHGVTFYKKN
ncbi:MAG: nucleotidyltransferase domain-containing protein [Candidatus Margulisbacteria bacterium]|nr:nucleotidyltransferase domain-containing protein [Candidatus Margulisiibacteriota bacterium]